MPKYNHDSFGDAVNHTYAKGVITAVDSVNDLADVTVGGYQDGSGVPLYYHCESDSELRSNGAIEGAAAAFSVDDEVIVMLDAGGAPVRIVGFVDGIQPCGGTIVIIVANGQAVAWDFHTQAICTGVTDNEGNIVTAWPVEYSTISEWEADLQAEEAEELFSVDWDADPTRSPTATRNVTVTKPDGCNDQFYYGYWGSSCGMWWDWRYQGKTDTIVQCDDASSFPNVRRWNFLDRQTTIHTLTNSSHKTESMHEPGRIYYDSEGSDQRQEYDSWSGQLVTILNEAGGELEFFRHITEVATDTSVCTSCPYRTWLVCFATASTSGYGNSVAYTVPEVDGAPVFSVSDMSEADGASWTAQLVSGWDVWEYDPEDCPCHLSSNISSNSVAAFDLLLTPTDPGLEAVCMLSATGKFSEDNDWAFYAFTRIKSELWDGRGGDPDPDVMWQYEAFVGAGVNNGAGTGPLAALTQKIEDISTMLEGMMNGAQNTHPTLRFYRKG